MSSYEIEIGLQVSYSILFGLAASEAGNMGSRRWQIENVIGLSLLGAQPDPGGHHCTFHVEILGRTGFKDPWHLR
jgi:hypothetical protein